MDTPDEPNYYNYKGKPFLKNTLQQEVTKYKNVFTCCYTVNNAGKFPFIRFLLLNSNLDKKLKFPQVAIFKNFDSDELIQFTKTCLYDLMMLDNYELYNNTIDFNGFYEYNNNLYLFFDLTNCLININEIYTTDKLWFALVDEIINYTHVCNINIDASVTELFTFNNHLCFLVNKLGVVYEVPIVGFVRKPENKVVFTHIFGEIKGDKNQILGPYYYFTDIYKVLKKDYEGESTCDEKYGLVRFALFVGNLKYIENAPNDPIDESDIKKQRCVDDNLNKVFESLTLRISDHDGLWSKTYDGAYLNNVELDNGLLLRKTMIVLKEYNQQIPLSYHYIGNSTKTHYSIL